MSAVKLALYQPKFFLFFFSSTGLVRLYIAGLPLRSCRTIGAPSVQGSAQYAFFSFLVAAGFEPTYFSLGCGHFNHYPRVVRKINIGKDIILAEKLSYFMLKNVSLLGLTVPFQTCLNCMASYIILCIQSEINPTVTS